MTRSELQKLAEVLDYIEHAKTRGDASCTLQPERFLRKGIADLDFDPYDYLHFGETTPEGWAKK